MPPNARTSDDTLTSQRRNTTAVRSRFSSNPENRWLKTSASVFKKHSQYFKLPLRTYSSYVSSRSLVDSWKISIQFLPRTSDPDCRDHDHGSDDVIVIEDFLFRELSYAGGVSHHKHGGVPSGLRVSIHEFSLSSEVGIVRCPEWEVKALREYSTACIKETRFPSKYACHTCVPGQLHFVEQYYDRESVHLLIGCQKKRRAAFNFSLEPLV